ncbi:hypothetical protein, partial [Baileyella intestinalis]|uniref:hypothetical protein n=1 Tax=Baileyella intestinalis TaxID=2606709 RepID=UPI0022E9160B
MVYEKVPISWMHSKEFSMVYEGIPISWNFAGNFSMICKINSHATAFFKKAFHDMKNNSHAMCKWENKNVQKVENKN